MNSEKKNNIINWGNPIKVVESDLPNLDNDPIFKRKYEEAVKDLRENPPPEWILKRMRGE